MTDEPVEQEILLYRYRRNGKAFISLERGSCSAGAEEMDWGFMCLGTGICIAGAEGTGRYLQKKNLLCGYRGSRLLLVGKGICSAAAKTGSRLLAAG